MVYNNYLTSPRNNNVKQKKKLSDYICCNCTGNEINPQGKVSII